MVLFVEREGQDQTDLDLAVCTTQRYIQLGGAHKYVFVEKKEKCLSCAMYLHEFLECQCETKRLFIWLIQI